MMPTSQHSGSNELIYLLQQLVKPWTDFKQQKRFYIWNLLPQLKRSPSSGSREEVRIINEIRNIASQEEWENLEEILEGMYSTESSKRKTASQVSEYLLTTSYQQDDRYLNFETSKEPLGNSDNPAITDSLLDTDMSFEIVAQVEDESFHEICADIANILADYRAGEIPQIAPADVERWIDQFEIADIKQKLVFAQGIDCMFSRYYYPKSRVKDSLADFLHKKIYTPMNIQNQVNVSFINNQDYGSSQNDMVNLAREILRETSDIEIVENREADLVVYLDDCVFSGNRVIREINDKWTKIKKKPTSKFYFYFFACHSKGKVKVEELLMKFLHKKGVDFYDFGVHQSSTFVNDRKNKNQFDILVPRKNMYETNGYNDETIEWISSIGPGHQKFLWTKDFPKQESVFNNFETRLDLETIFLEKGVYLFNKIGINKNVKGEESIRPLGFDKDNNIGFGAMFMSYRNIANNCPVVFWLEGEKCGQDWKPLLKRKSSRPGVWWW